MAANAPLPTPPLEEMIAALEKLSPEQQHTAITLLHLIQTASDTIAPTSGDLTTRERYMLALFGTLKAEQEAAARPPEYVHPVIEALGEANDSLTDFSVDAWERDPTDGRQIASRYDEARALVSQALNIARVAIKLDK